MNTSTWEIDLIVLVADTCMKAALQTLLSLRYDSLGIREIHFEIHKHQRHDPGCYHESPEFLRGYLSRAKYCLVVFDREGSGQESSTADEITIDLRKRLSESGWRNRAEVVVITPELESWIWSDSPNVDRALGWDGRDPSLREWLRGRGQLLEGEIKPRAPKQAVEDALREVGIPRSSSIYAELAKKVGLQRCQDPAFHRLREILRSWFPE